MHLNVCVKLMSVLQSGFINSTGHLQKSFQSDILSFCFPVVLQWKKSLNNRKLFTQKGCCLGRYPLYVTNLKSWSLYIVFSYIFNTFGTDGTHMDFGAYHFFRKHLLKACISRRTDYSKKPASVFRPSETVRS